MKIKTFLAALSLLLVLVIVSSCTNISVNEQSKTSGVTGSQTQSGDKNQSNTSSKNPSSESNVSKDESTSHEVLPLPYSDITKIKYKDIKKDALDDYFADSVFIGNSIMVHFKNYYSNKKAEVSGFLGRASFFCLSNYSAEKDFGEITNESWHPSYAGEKMHSWDAIKAMKAKTVYLNLMALNELALHSGATCVKDTMNNTIKLVEKIKAVSPDVNIVILSNTYMVYNYNGFGILNNFNISEFNNAALKYCNENNMDFVDISTFLMEGNVLKNDYCSDWKK
ncbi:MAG: hypothetical protein RR246_02000, partial [Clostridia bacterium]